MKKLISVFAITLITTFPAIAQDIGLGWEDGASIKIPTEKLMLQGVLNFSAISGDENSGIADGTSFGLAGYASYPLSTFDRSKLNFFGGLGILSNPDQDTTFGIRFGLERIVMVTDHIGVGGKLGIQFLSVGGADNVDNSGGSIFGLWGLTSVHWFF